jgi:hypothetical protein
MARIMVDKETVVEDTTEFAFKNQDGDIEFVLVDKWEPEIVSIKLECSDVACVYLKDVPLLIKALQAAYNFKQQGEKI